jgi:hypothetical protein
MSKSVLRSWKRANARSWPLECLELIRNEKVKIERIRMKNVRSTRKKCKEDEAMKRCARSTRSASTVRKERKIR